MEEKFAKHRGLMVFHCRCIAGWTIACLIHWIDRKLQDTL